MAKKKIENIDEVKEPKKVSKKELKSEQEKFADDMSSFLEKSCGLEIQTLNERDEINYFLDSGSYAMNWIIGDSFFDGLPGAKAILVAGECLGPDCEIIVKVPEKIAKLLI